MSQGDKQADKITIRVGGAKELGAEKMARNTASFDADAPRLRKPPWIRVRLPAGNAVADLKSRLRNRESGYGLRGSDLPQHPRMFFQGDGHLHDPW